MEHVRQYRILERWLNSVTQETYTFIADKMKADIDVVLTNLQAHLDNGVPDYAFALDYQLRQRLGQILQFYNLCKKSSTIENEMLSSLDIALEHMNVFRFDRT